MTTPPPADRYEELHGAFRWHVPRRFNIADACCARWARATPNAVAIRYEHENGERLTFTYAQLQRDANRLSAALKALGVVRGEPRRDRDCRSVSRPRSRTWPSTSSARSRCRSRSCSAPTRSSTA